MVGSLSLSSNLVLCSDSASPCEPWEGVWAPGVKVSCLSTCLAAMSDCTSLNITGADYGNCNGVYDLLESEAPEGDMPAYKKRDYGRYLFSSGTQWKIGSSIGGGVFAWSGGESGQYVPQSSLIPHYWLQEVRRCASPGRRTGLTEIDPD